MGKAARSRVRQHILGLGWAGLGWAGLGRAGRPWQGSVAVGQGGTPFGWAGHSDIEFLGIAVLGGCSWHSSLWHGYFRIIFLLMILFLGALQRLGRDALLGVASR